MKLRAASKVAAIGLVKFYQRRFSYRTGRCVFTPSCSEYAVLAIAKFGVVKGVLLTGRRLARCHGAHAGVVDHP